MPYLLHREVHEGDGVHLHDVRIYVDRHTRSEVEVVHAQGVSPEYLLQDQLQEVE